MAAKLVPVTVQLNWKHQFEYAAFYAAIDQEAANARLGICILMRMGRIRGSEMR